MNKYIYGLNAVYELVKSRPEDIKSIWLNDDKSLRKQNLIKILDDLNLPYQIRPKQDFIQLMPRSDNHQGIVAFVIKIKEYKDKSWLLKRLKENEQEQMTILILDSILDPQNFGAILRSAVAFGVEIIIIGKHNNAPLSATTYKSAAGAVEHLSIVQVNNLNQLLGSLKDADFWIYGLTGEAKQNIAEIKFDKKRALILGSEGAGIRHLVKENCDFLVKIPINKKQESLNVSVACAVVLYHLSL
ncbi:MAG: 23S rRNA (guanosine(2251)-2'-O)-methyltransferase RlmB [Gammaproteobacteria bacterium]|nr:MAG: 23S rRNA (guanosine(2251)-2'-O)-methyltransferase RlmB [Gammaproteobacteria bacterium]